MQLFGEWHVPPPLFRVDPSLYVILSDVYTSLQAPFNAVKSLHFAKINQDRIALLLLGDLKANVPDG
jgi:hypothetical protein